MPMAAMQSFAGASRFSGGFSWPTRTRFYKAPPPPPPPALLPKPKDRLFEAKFHPVLVEVWHCWKKNPVSCKPVQDGKLKIRIWLTHDTANVRAQLAALGIELATQRSGGQYLTGKIAMEKLEALAKMPEVKFVSL
jgi:hypothetical protein